MKLYKITATKEDAKDDFTRWVGSLTSASATRKDLVSAKHYKRDNVNTFEVDVPTNKEGLLNFLNNDGD